MKKIQQDKSKLTLQLWGPFLREFPNEKEVS